MSAEKFRVQRRGFTMLELLLSLVVGGLAALATVVVFGGQNRAAESQRKQVDAQQNARVAMDVLVRELRQAGANIDRFHRQSVLVDAAPYQMVFNADVRSGIGGDPAMQASGSVPLGDGTTYSPGAFLDENLEDLSRFNNGAETVRLTLDTSGDGVVDSADELAATHVPGDFHLVRQINGGSLESVALGLRGPEARPDGTNPPPLFQYWGTFGGGARALWGDANGDGELSSSEIASLQPVSRTELDNIHEIVLVVEALGNDTKRGDDARQNSSTILTSAVRPRNIGLNASNLSACGYPPMPPTNVVAQDTPDDGGRSITLTFNASFDDHNGESDVREYSVYRRRVGVSTFGAPIYSMKAAGQTTYAFVNNESNSVRAEDAPEDGVAYEYYVTAWDCEPQESNPSIIAGPVVSSPNGPEPPVITDAFDTPCDTGGQVTVRFGASPDDNASEEQFSGYRVYRGTDSGITAYKVRVLEVAAQNIASYTVQDVGNSLLPMSPDSTYYYVVRGVRAGIESVDSNQWGPVYVSSGLARPVLAAVEDLPGDFGNRLELTWAGSPSESCTPPDNVMGYVVKRRSQYQSLFSPVHHVTALTGGVYTWIDTLVVPDQVYTYVVAALGTSEEALSNEMSGRATAENELEPPVAVAAEDEPCDPLGAVRVTWTASPNDDEGEMTHYRIFRGTAPGVYDHELPWVEATGAETYSIVDDANSSGSRAPQLGVTYYYAGRSWNDYYSLQSTRSNESSVLAESTPTAPGAASAIDTPNDGGRSIDVRFERSDQDGVCDNTVSVYKIYRGTSPGVLSTLVGVVTATQQPVYTFVDNLVYSYDAPYDGIDYYYGVRAYASELVSKLSEIAGPVQSVRDGSVNNTIFADDFETDRGWTHSAVWGADDWVRATPLGRSAPNGGPDPASAVSGTKAWGTTFGPTTGAYSRNASMVLVSPKVDCRSAGNVMLRFKRWLNVEKSSRDKADIEVRTAASGWTRVWRNPGSIDVLDTSWSPFELDISAIAAGQRDVQVRFVLTTNSSREYSGWNIDDFVLEDF